MHKITRPIFRILSVGCFALSIAILLNGSAFAQAKQDAPPAAAAPVMEVPPVPKQMPLTEKQIEAVLASQKDLDAITEKLPEDSVATRPDPKVMAQLDGVSKKYGFADYAEYNAVVENISLVLAGFDPQTRKYVGPEAVIKGQIAAVQADKKMPAKDKKDALEELNEALKTPAPAIENKANVDLVTKYYDKLAAVMQESDE